MLEARQIAPNTIDARTKEKLLINRRKINLKCLAFSYSKVYGHVPKAKLKTKKNEASLLIQTRRKINAHEISVLEMAANT